MWWKITIDRDDAVLMIAMLVSAAAISFTRIITAATSQQREPQATACLGGLRAANRKFVSGRCALHHSNN